MDDVKHLMSRPKIVFRIPKHFWQKLNILVVVMVPLRGHFTQKRYPFEGTLPRRDTLLGLLWADPFKVTLDIIFSGHLISGSLCLLQLSDLLWVLFGLVAVLLFVCTLCGFTVFMVLLIRN